MNYSVIFSSGYDDDVESLTRGLKSDVLIKNVQDVFYQINFITLERIRGEFDSSKSCYLEDNMVILHEITKENILQCVRALHAWDFEKQWVPLTQQQLERYFYPKENWVVFHITTAPG
jgi:hypothetical protein